MAGEMIEAVRNEHVLVNVKWRCDPLREHIRDIVVGVGLSIRLVAGYSELIGAEQFLVAEADTYRMHNS